MKVKRLIVALMVSVLSLGVFFGCTSSSSSNNGIKGKLFTKESLDSKVYENLPIIEIETEEHQVPIDKENYINCSFKLSNCEDETHNIEVSMKNKYGDDDSVGIRLRGNTTRLMDKKPYRIKFDSKTSLFGLEKNKSWVLLADYKDSSKIRNYAAMTLGNSLENLDFTPTPHHVVLFMNGYYQGLYLLCEQIDENKGRTNVKDDILPTDINFPFLVEMDRRALEEGITGVDNFRPEYFQPVEIKYPETEDRIEGTNDVVFEYVEEYINATFKSLVNSTAVDVSFSNNPMSFEDLVDVDSFIEYYLVNEVMYNSDASWGSIYMHKSKNGKLKFGPIWDFDWSMSGEFDYDPYNKSEIGLANQLCILTNDSPLYYFAKNETNFEKLCNKWAETKEKVNDVCDQLKDYKSTIIEASKFDAEYWYGETGAYQADMQYDYVRLFLLDRVAYFNETLVVENYNTIFN